MDDWSKIKSDWLRLCNYFSFCFFNLSGIIVTRSLFDCLEIFRLYKLLGAVFRFSYYILLNNDFDNSFNS